MAKTKIKTKASDLDMVYFLKMVLYLVLGSFWVKFTFGTTGQLPIPVGLLIGLYLVRKDSRQIDRKIGMAILLLAMLVGFWTPIGLYVAL